MYVYSDKGTHTLWIRPELAREGSRVRLVEAGQCMEAVKTAELNAENEKEAAQER